MNENSAVEQSLFCKRLEGGSLLEKISSGSLYEGDERQVQLRILEIASAAAQELLNAHKKGIVHCDVKPSNIMFREDGVVKIADFGSSKQITKRGGVTLEEEASGYTIPYCPKEQMEGQPVKPWMDIYSWALTVLEMYLGKRVWQTGAEAQEHFEECVPLCRVPLPPAMKKLLAGCLTWKINDFSLVLKDLDKIPELVEKAISETGTAGEVLPAEDQKEGTGEKPEHAEGVEESVPGSGEDPAETPKPIGLFGRLRKLFSGGKRE